MYSRPLLHHQPAPSLSRCGKAASVLLLFFLACSFSSCVEDQVADPIDQDLERQLLRLSASGTLQDYILPDGKTLAAIPAGIGNTITAEKVKLGKMLFYETALGRDAVWPSGMRTFSCSSCHVPEAAFTAGAAQGIADGGVGFGTLGSDRRLMDDFPEELADAQGARPLSMLGVAYVQNSMWAGRFGARFNNADTENLWGVFDPSTEVNHLGLDGLEAQNIEGTIVHRMSTDAYLLDTLGYREMFDDAYYDWPAGDVRYGRVAMSFALSAYIRSILPDRAPWQKWLRGDKTAMNEEETRGALLFFGKAGCYRCHNGPALNGNRFEALGVNDLCDVPGGAIRTGLEDPRNLGRGDFTRRPDELYQFKVPQVYNTRDMPFYFHGSSKTSLREVIEYKNAGIKENPRVPDANISDFFHPLNLTADEMDDLEAFLSEALHDPDLTRYAPASVLSGNCMPNNDPQSREDIGCE
ncbi:MAG: cytochrome c peroxidase [Saprospiraceae bacterium]